MIQVERLTKTFGSITAVNDIGFAVQAGEIVGFLGLNGAGKTTTMRILAGSLGASRGRALIAGIDIVEDPKGAKRKLGYLPERPPLYPQMTVNSYLLFCAQLKDVSEPQEAVDQVLQAMELSDVAQRLIGHLSKGFKQRVGLAQALLHNPTALLLDEPVSGLDPAQRKSMLDLIEQRASEGAAILLSSHVLAEIEPICHRVIILNEGRVVAKDTIKNLTQDRHEVTLAVCRPDEAFFKRLQSIEGVTHCEQLAGGRYRIQASSDIREHIARVSIDAGLLELRPVEDLQGAFMRLTGKPS